MRQLRWCLAYKPATFTAFLGAAVLTSLCANLGWSTEIRSVHRSPSHLSIGLNMATPGSYVLSDDQGRVCARGDLSSGEEVIAVKKIPGANQLRLDIFNGSGEVTDSNIIEGHTDRS